MNSVLALFISLLCINEMKCGIISLLNLNRCYIEKSLNLDMSELNLYFYDYEKQIYINGSAEEAVKNISDYVSCDTARKLAVYVPGFPSDMDEASCQLSREIFQKVPNTYLLIVDYSAYANPLPIIDIDVYYAAIYYSYAIGNAVGTLIAQINKAGYPTKNIYAYGHSFGAQILGYIGEKYYEETSEKIPKITGIDPAAPCFATSPVTDQLRSGVADHVEVYHCSELGSRRNLSDAEYYYDPNGTLKKCENVINYYEESCIHENCVESWLSTVLDPGQFAACFPEDFSDGCSDNCTTVSAGFYSSPVKGVYYASTVNATSIVDPDSDYYYYIFKFFFSFI